MALVAKLTARVAELEEQVRRSSRNSSKPPSSDAPSAPARQKKRPTGRNPGGQPGHERSVRPLVAPEKVRKIVECVPDRCEHCDGLLRGHDLDPRRHQVAHLPKVEPVIDEYRLHSLDCKRCGKTTVGKLPAGVRSGAFGPSVIAVVALLMGSFRLSKRLVPELMRDLFGLHISIGAAVGCQQLASEAIAAPVDDARAHVIEQPVKHADETSWREGVRRGRAWLWVVVTAKVAVFMIHARRNADAARQLLGNRWLGVLVSDRHGAYHWWPDCRRQMCWAHLERDITAIAERGGASGRAGRAMLDEIARMFAWWHRIRDGTLARSTFRVYMRSVRCRFEALLAEGATIEHAKTRETCKLLLKRRDALWTFVYIDGVEPTNNAAERIIRHGVILRKLSHGTHSERGSRFIERILTVHATLRLQERNVLEFLRHACEAHLCSTLPPSLLPQNTVGRLKIAA